MRVLVAVLLAPVLIAAARPVRVMEVRIAPRAASEVFSGNVQARVTADLGFRVGGKIVARPVEIGDRVRAGQVLARLDPQDLALAVREAEGAAREAEAAAADAAAALARYRRLGAASPAFQAGELDRRRFAAAGTADRAEQALRRLAVARDQLGYAVLVADADGVITALPGQVGQVVQAGQTVAQLAHDGGTEVWVDVPEDRLPMVRAARAVTVAAWSAPDRAVPGRVREIGALADPVSRTYTVKVAVPASGLALGMTASVRFAGPEGAPAAVLPASALVDRDGAPAVWVFDPAHGRAVARRVHLAGFADDGDAIVDGGLAEGERVVTAGAALVTPEMDLVAWTGAAR